MKLLKMNFEGASNKNYKMFGVENSKKGSFLNLIFTIVYVSVSSDSVLFFRSAPIIKLADKTTYWPGVLGSLELSFSRTFFFE